MLQGLPMHGQKTKTNARTRKGKKVGVMQLPHQAQASCYFVKRQMRYIGLFESGS